MKRKTNPFIMSYNGYTFNILIVILKAIATLALTCVVIGELILLAL